MLMSLKILTVVLCVACPSFARALVILEIGQDGYGAIVNEYPMPITFDGYQVADSKEPGRLIPANHRAI